MIRAGTITLMQFPHGDLSVSKLRPVLIITKAPSPFNDWIVCMVSTQTQHHIDGVDEIIDFDDSDYRQSGVKTRSVIRVGQLLTTDQSNFIGAVGSISKSRFVKIQRNLAHWFNKGTSRT